MFKKIEKMPLIIQMFMNKNFMNYQKKFNEIFEIWSDNFNHFLKVKKKYWNSTPVHNTHT